MTPTRARLLHLPQVSRTLAGHGGVAGVKPRKIAEKFVIGLLKLQL